MLGFGLEFYPGNVNWFQHPISNTLVMAIADFDRNDITLMSAPFPLQPNVVALFVHLKKIEYVDITIALKIKWFPIPLHTDKRNPILCMRPANEGRRYIVTSSLICWAHTQNDPRYTTAVYAKMLPPYQSIYDQQNGFPYLPDVMLGMVNSYIIHCDNVKIILAVYRTVSWRSIASWNSISV